MLRDDEHVTPMDVRNTMFNYDCCCCCFLTAVVFHLGIVFWFHSIHVNGG